MLTHKKTKIIATVGPASDKEEVLEKIIMAGADCIRLNFSHGNYEWHQSVISNVRSLEKKLKKNIAIIADIQGPKIRVGIMPKEGANIQQGEKIVFNCDLKEYKGNEIPLPSQMFKGGVKEGDVVFLDDGTLSVKITKKLGSKFEASVLKGGFLFSNKGINVPSIKITGSVFSDKDKSDVKFAVSHGADYLALSFLREGKDIKEIRSLINNSQIKIIAKIERPEALANLDGIIEEADVVMVARGDLGIETPMWELPIRQKEIITKVREKMKQVIVATQMLDSMIRNPLPTRAEVSDVANAVYDSTDAVMLSGESASGKNPVEAVEMMRKILEATDSNQTYSRVPEEMYDEPYIYLSKSAADVSSELKTKAIFVKTQSGRSAKSISSFRPQNTVVAITQDEMVSRQLSLVWGVLPILIGKKSIKKIDDFVLPAVSILKKENLIKSGDSIVCVYDHKFESPNKTSANSISIKTV